MENGTCSQFITVALCPFFLLILFSCSRADLHRPQFLPGGCSTTVFFRGCRGISILVPGAPPPPPFAVLAGLFLKSFLSLLTACAVFSSYRCFPWGATTLFLGLICAPQWVSWCWLKPVVSGMGQPWPLLTEAAPQLPLPAPGHLYLVQGKLRLWDA